MNKKVYLKAYIKKNLGDDLLLKVFSDRYSEKNKIYLYAGNDYKKTLSKNVKTIKNIFIIIFNKILKKFSKGKCDIQVLLYKKVDCIVKLGGSIFMEKYDKNYKENAILEYPKNKKYYIINSNFGPYETDEYYKTYFEVFENAEDVSFREEYSYNLFKALPNVRFGLDVAFCMDTSNINITNRKRVIFSIVDVEKKVASKYKNDYEKKILELINFFEEKGYEILLMSFCRAENDEREINNILKQIPNKKIEKYFYRGNINEALNILGDSSIIVGSRLHANVIGLVLEKTIIPIAYSDKTINVLNDIGFEGKIIDIRNLNLFDVKDLTDDDLEYKLSVQKQRKLAENQFKKLDLELL